MFYSFESCLGTDAIEKVIYTLIFAIVILHVVTLRANMLPYSTIDIRSNLSDFVFQD